MLPPDSRAILTEQLRPSKGWRLDHAVATTFTLDLSSALVAPLAFAAHEVRDTADPVTVMESVRACADRVDVFCQAGHISFPKNASQLFAFLEPMVHQVTQPRPHRLFHPKLWLARFTDGAASFAYRLLVLSRNLTADRCWDVCLRLDGTVGERAHTGNDPLAALLNWLVHRCIGGLDAARAQRIRDMAESLRLVEWERPNDVRALRFHVLGVGLPDEVSFAGTRHLVVSPFVNEGGLGRTVPVGSREAHLVSRQEELDRLPESALGRLRPRVLNALAGLGDDESGVLTGLHAKLYVVEYDHQARVYVGSANATDAAFDGNVEILVEMAGSKHRFGIASMVGPDAPFAEILEPYSRSDETPQDADWEMTELVRRVAATPLVATVTADGDHYRLDVSSSDRLPRFDDTTRITIELVTVPGRAMNLAGGGKVDVAFGGVRLTQITPFLAVHATGRAGARHSAVLVATLVNDPDDRLDVILAKQIDSPEKFLRFIALLLGLIRGDGLVPGEAGSGTAQWQTGLGAGVFELLVRALVDHPDALTTLGRLVERMRRTEAGRRNLPTGFDVLWTEIEAAHARLRPEPTDDPV